MIKKINGCLLFIDWVLKCIPLTTNYIFCDNFYIYSVSGIPLRFETFHFYKFYLSSKETYTGRYNFEFLGNWTQYYVGY